MDNVMETTVLARNFFFIREAGGKFLGEQDTLTDFGSANVYHRRENAEKMIRRLERMQVEYTDRGEHLKYAWIAELVARVYEVVEGTCQVG